MTDELIDKDFTDCTKDIKLKRLDLLFTKIKKYCYKKNNFLFTPHSETQLFGLKN